MSIDADEAFTRGLDFFGDTVGRLGAGDWERPSPCAGWRALDVLGHVGAAMSMGTAVLRGERMDMSWSDPPGTNVVEEPGRWWEGVSAPAGTALAQANLDEVVDSPLGRRSVRSGLSFPAADLFVHAWDLSRTIGREMEIPGDAIDFVYALIEPMPRENVRSERVFAEEASVPGGATPTQRLIAWTGRDPLWAPPARG